MRSCCLLCRCDFVIAPLQSTVPRAALRSGRVCCVPVTADDAGGEQRPLSWKKAGMGSNEGEETCGGAARPAGRDRDGEEKQVAFVGSGETFGCHVSRHLHTSACTHWSYISGGPAHMHRQVYA